MTIKDQSPTATHRSSSNQEASSSNQQDSIDGTAENDNFYSVHDTAAPPPYYQAAEQAGPSIRPDTDRNSLEELTPTPISHSIDEDDEERRPLLSSRSRKKRKRRIPFSVALILFATLASVITWFIARRIKDEEDDVYIPAPSPDPKLGKLISKGNWSTPRIMDNDKSEPAWFTFSEFALPISSNLSLSFFSEGTKFQGSTVFSNVLDTPPKGKILIRAEVYADDQDMFKTLAVSQLQKRRNEQIMSVLQSDGNRWKDSKSLEVALLVMFPEEMRRGGRDKKATSTLSHLHSKGVMGLVNAEDLLFGDVFVDSISDVQIRTMSATGPVTVISEGRISSGSLLKSNSNVNLTSRHSIQVEKVESSVSIALSARGVTLAAELISPTITSRSVGAGVSIALASVSKALYIKAANGLQCDVELLSSPSSSNSRISSQSTINVSAIANRGFTKVGYRSQPEDVVLFSKVQTGDNDLRVQHADSFQGDFKAETSKGDVILRNLDERSVLLDVDERKGEARRIEGRVWSKPIDHSREAESWGESIITNSEGILWFDF